MSLSCRICLEDDSRLNLISPCNCDGTTKYIHRECLETWRITNIDNDNYKRCEICQFEYEMETRQFSTSEKIIKNILRFYSNNFFFLFLTIELFILLFTYIYSSTDLDGTLKMFFDIDDYSEEYYILGVFTVIGILFIFIFIHDLRFYLQYKNSKSGTNFYFKNYAFMGIHKLIFFIIFSSFIYVFNITIGSLSSIFLIHLIINYMFEKRYKIDIINERVKDQNISIELEEINV